jgi:hypothetical protein
MALIAIQFLKEFLLFLVFLSPPIVGNGTKMGLEEIHRQK